MNTATDKKPRLTTSAMIASASGRQLPQVEPNPVRMVSSDTELQPASVASRTWRSVTPLQMQTYMACRGNWIAAITTQTRMIVNN